MFLLTMDQMIMRNVKVFLQRTITWPHKSTEHFSVFQLNVLVLLPAALLF